MMTIIAVGHTPWKMDRLDSMLPTERSIIRVWNGDGARKGTYHILNDRLGRDVSMYYAGLEHTTANCLVFLNDDVVCIDTRFWDEVDQFSSSGLDISGVANLSSWVDYDLCNEGMLRHSKEQGRKLRFIRTSAFMATRDHFLKVYEQENGMAQPFEKNTLMAGTKYKCIPPQYAYDSNIERYV